MMRQACLGSVASQAQLPDGVSDYVEFERLIHAERTCAGIAAAVKAWAEYKLAGRARPWEPKSVPNLSFTNDDPMRPFATACALSVTRSEIAQALKTSDTTDA